MMITAQQVKTLRDKTGLSMGDCKTALTKANGDESAAIDILRQMGLTRIVDVRDRAAVEGRIGITIRDTVASIVEMRCETQPVASTKNFIDLTNLVAGCCCGETNAETVLMKTITRIGSNDSKEQLLKDVIAEEFNKLRENIVIHRFSSIVGSAEQPVGHYLHHTGTVGCILQMSQPCSDDVMKDVGMQICSMNAQYCSVDDVPAELVEKEKTFLSVGLESKPPQIIEKIITGKLAKWYESFVLLQQPFVKDDKVSVGKMLEAVSPGLTVLKFVKYKIGQVT